MAKRLGVTIGVLFVMALIFAAGFYDRPAAVLPIASPLPPFASSNPAGQVEAEIRRLDYLDPASWYQQVHHPQAAFVKLHVDNFDLRPGDYLTVASPDGTESYQYPANHQLSNPHQAFWVLSISGDTAIIRLHAAARNDDSIAYQGVIVDRYAWGYPPRAAEQPELFAQDICGQNERIDVSCYEDTYPTEFSRVAPVARVVMPVGVGAFPSCTAWRLGPNNHLLANEHCIADQTQLEAAEFWFNYQRPACGSGDPGPVVKVAGDQLLAINGDPLDFTLFNITDFASIAQFGYLELDLRQPLLAEEIYIPQHGAGNPKEFGLESDQNSGGLCQIDKAVMKSPRDGAPNIDTGYYCDTIEGSSGSPVLARSSNKVLALHHWGGCLNRGVRMDQIWPVIKAEVCGTVSSPVPLSPANGSSTASNTLTLRWAGSQEFAQYQLQVDNSPDFSSPEIEVTLTDTSYTPTTLSADQPYYWRVRQRSVFVNCQTFSGWSTPASFAIGSNLMIYIPLILK